MIGYITAGVSGVVVVIAQTVTPDGTPEVLRWVLTGGVPVITTYAWWRADAERKAANDRALEAAERREKEWVPVVVEHTGVMKEVKVVLQRALDAEARGRREAQEP